MHNKHTSLVTIFQDHVQPLLRQYVQYGMLKGLSFSLETIRDVAALVMSLGIASKGGLDWLVQQIKDYGCTVVTDISIQTTCRNLSNFLSGIANGCCSPFIRVCQAISNHSHAILQSAIDYTNEQAVKIEEEFKPDEEDKSFHATTEVSDICSSSSPSEDESVVGAEVMSLPSKLVTQSLANNRQSVKLVPRVFGYDEDDVEDIEYEKNLKNERNLASLRRSDYTPSYHHGYGRSDDGIVGTSDGEYAGYSGYARKNKSVSSSQSRNADEWINDNSNVYPSGFSSSWIGLQGQKSQASSVYTRRAHVAVAARVQITQNELILSYQATSSSQLAYGYSAESTNNWAAQNDFIPSDCADVGAHQAQPRDDWDALSDYINRPEAIEAAQYQLKAKQHQKKLCLTASSKQPRYSGSDLHIR